MTTKRYRDGTPIDAKDRLIEDALAFFAVVFLVGMLWIIGMIF